MRRLAGVAFGLLLLSGCRVIVVSAIPAQPTTEVSSRVIVAATPPPMMVFGEPSEFLMEGIAYWNRAADAEVLKWAGPFPQTTPDHTTVTVEITTVNDGDLAAYAAGNVGSTPIRIVIDPDYAADWTVYGHELGHALGLDDYNTGQDYGISDPSYRGIMSYRDADSPVWSDDTDLLQGF